MSGPDLKDVVLRAADRMPFLPVVFQRTLALFAEGDEVPVGKVAIVVEQDVVMAGHLISIANSALYSRASSVSSVRQAIARIGIQKTRNTLLGLSVARSFRNIRLPKNWSSARFNAHSLATAVLSDLLAQRVQTESAEWAFLAGLLHDIGLLLIATGLPDQSLSMADTESDYQLAGRERQLLGFTHFEVGAELLARWNCPAIVQHASVFCQSDTFQFQNPFSLGMVVKTASLIADSNGIAVFGSNQDLTFAAQLLDVVGIQRPKELMELFRMEYSAIQSGVASGGPMVSV